MSWGKVLEGCHPVVELAVQNIPYFGVQVVQVIDKILLDFLEFLLDSLLDPGFSVL